MPTLKELAEKHTRLLLHAYNRNPDDLSGAHAAMERALREARMTVVSGIFEEAAKTGVADE